MSGNEDHLCLHVLYMRESLIVNLVFGWILIKQIWNNRPDSVPYETPYCMLSTKCNEHPNRINILTRSLCHRWIIMTGLFVCILESWLGHWAKGLRHAVIQIMREWSRRGDNQTCVCVCVCVSEHMGKKQPSVRQFGIRLADMCTRIGKQQVNLHECMQGDKNAPVLQFT